MGPDYGINPKLNQSHELENFGSFQFLKLEGKYSLLTNIL
jgi:hypothetical protein